MKSLDIQSKITGETAPRIIIANSGEELDVVAAEIIEKQISNKPDTTLTLPTGATPLGMYAKLVEKYKSGLIDFSLSTIFNLDEYWPIKHTHPSSYFHYMKTNLIDHINVPKDHWHIPNGEAISALDESIRYGMKLSKADIDLAVVGIGPGTTCHIGFNEKGSDKVSVTRYVPLDTQTVTANSRYFDDKNKMPTGAITQGISDILKAKRIVLIAKGKTKAWGIRRTLKGEVNSDCPASYLRLHNKVTFILDQAAASEI